MKVIGLDIGTTTICAIVIDTEKGDVLKTVASKNDTHLKGSTPFERIQNPKVILEKCFNLIEELTEEFPSVTSIGITGQMHGILYLDKDGSSLSPLYFWQDESGNEPFNEKQTYAEYLTGLTGYKMAAGFGGTTYFYHSHNGNVPKNAVKFCTIHDYFAMKLCGKSEPLVHTSDAASLGFFDLNLLRFDEQAVRKAGLDFSLFPHVTKEFDIVGKYNNQIPVSVAIGDNQASFLGSVNDMDNCLLVNVGTGSQISYLTNKTTTAKGLEIRPCFGDKFICVGSSLCGGRAFALLEEFLRKTAELVTGEESKSAYPAIDDYLAYSQPPENPLKVSTRFGGTRDNPEERGSVDNLGLDNFTPQHLIWGVLGGMVEELQAMYRAAGEQTHSLMIASGNGLRKNLALQKLFTESFGIILKIPAHSEEAAFGAALFGMTAAGFEENIYTAQKMIKYR